MIAISQKYVHILVCTVGMYTLSACGWVDSKGEQGVDIDAQTLDQTVDQTQTNTLTSSSELQTAQPLTIMENTAVTAKLTGDGATLQDWAWVEDNKDEIYRCSGIDGFDTAFAVTSIADACTSESECSIAINETHSEDGTKFTLSIPSLNSPLAMNYSLTNTLEDGTVLVREQLLCAIPINEAPQALDDSYIVRRNITTLVSATDSYNLLSNDTDDIDFRNSQLRVILDPVEAPKYAANFSLDADGGFLYQASATAPIDSSGETLDSFEYAITDGIHTVTASVFIRIIDTNEAPVQLTQIPDVVFNAAHGNDDSHIRIMNLSPYFADADSDNLTFESKDFESTLGLTISPQGILTADATILDVNQWRAIISVSDGIESIESSFVVTIRIPESLKSMGSNEIPTASDIKNSSFTGEFTYDVSEFFNDADADDQLTYTAVGLPTGVQIRADGVIEGTVSASNSGRSFVQVTAEDGYGGYVTDGFNLTLD